MDHTTATSPHVAVSTTDASAPAPGRSLRRRGLVAGAAALVAATVAAQPVRAAQLVGTNGTWNGAPDSNPDGVQGYTTGASNAGVFGRNNDLNGLGIAGAAPSGIGVAGSSGNGPGVSGVSTSSYGVFGTSTGGTGTGGVSSTGYGLIGVATASSGYGLVAYNSATGGYAASLGGIVLVTGTQYVSSSAGAGYSLVAYTSTSGYYAIEGIGNTAGAHGLYAAPGSGGVAAVLNGDVVVTGGLTVYGSYPKNAAVPHPDGSYRLLYCTESPEPWFEDFGVATLTGGTATVALDPDFAAVAVTSGYHVFLTPRGDCNGLAVTAQTAAGFTVRELRGGTSTLSFSWRLAARRGDIAGNRFATFTPPTVVATPPPPAAPTLSPDLPPPALPPAAPATPLKAGPPVTPVVPTSTATVLPMPGPTAPATAAPTVTGTLSPTATPVSTPVPTATMGSTAPAPTIAPTAPSAPTMTGSTSTTVPMATTTSTRAAMAAAAVATTGTGSTATAPALTATPRPSGTAGSAASATATTGTGSTRVGTAGTVPNATPPPH